jgi:hypothetical protein
MLRRTVRKVLVNSIARYEDIINMQSRSENNAPNINEHGNYHHAFNSVSGRQVEFCTHKVQLHVYHLTVVLNVSLGINPGYSLSSPDPK